jgi:uncharacterized membrane protein
MTAVRVIRTIDGMQHSTTRRQDAVTVVVSGWLMVGLFIDGWAHNTRPGLETFFTPWHFAFYSGFAACVVRIGLLIRPRLAGGRSVRGAIPIGYGWTAAGLLVFAAGGLGDLTWHTVFGIEQDVDALFSPTHLLLFVGILLIVTTPIRSARARGFSAPDRAVDVVQVAVTLTTGLVLFFVQYLSLFNESFEQLSRARVLAHPLPGIDSPEFLQGTLETQVLFGTTALVVSAVIVGVPLSWLARQRGMRRGAVMFHIATLGVLLNAIDGFDKVGLVAGAVLAGVVVEVAVAIVRPEPDRAAARHLLAAAVPGVLLVGHVAAVGITNGVGFEAEFWTGTIVLAALAGLGLDVLGDPGPTAASVA